MRTIKNKMMALVAGILLVVGAVSVAAMTPNASEDALKEARIGKNVRHELVTLPYYGIFDNLAYKVEGGTVTLYGQVVRPSTRADAARRVAKIDGVTNVINRIEVLPLSGFDDSIRYRTVRALANTGGLYRYMLGANPSLHIIVNNGRVALEGVVANEGDRRLAYIIANTVPGVFSVTNNLRTDQDKRNS
jgi:hyperosmotically inducible protein